MRKSFRLRKPSRWWSGLPQAVQQQEAGGRTDWLEVEGCWVLRPPPEAGRPRAVAFFCGGAFAGAAPQLTYRLLLECLARRNMLVSCCSGV